MIQGSPTVGQEMLRTWQLLPKYLAAYSFVDASKMARTLFG